LELSPPVLEQGIDQGFKAEPNGTEGLVSHSPAQDGATVCALQQPFLFEETEIAVDGDVRNAQQLTEVRNVYVTLLLQEVGDVVAPLRGNQTYWQSRMPYCAKPNLSLGAG